MSKTTFFKRIALTAIAALGFGMLSVAPSQAIAGTPTVTVTAGNASVTLGSGQETKTAAAITVTGLLGETTDSYIVKVTRKSAVGSSNTDAHFKFGLYDTVTYASTRVDDIAGVGFTDLAATQTNLGVKSNASDSDTVANNTGYVIAPSAATGGYVGARFYLLIESLTATTRVAGVYTFTTIVTPVSNGSLGTPVLTDVTFTINDTDENLAATNGTIDATKTTAFLGTGTAVPTADGANITAVATSSATTRATLAVRTYTEDSLKAPESVTVTITGPGLVGTAASGVYGKSIRIAADGEQNFLIRSDGTAGTSSIVVATTTKTFAAKTMRFYALAASTVTVSVNTPVIGVVSTDDVVRATFKDASGNVWAGAAYIYAVAAADAVIAGSVTPAACTWDATDDRHECPLTGASAGTGNFKVIDAATVALATTTSDAAAVRVSQGAASSVTLSFDKATYAPGEKAQLRVLVLDEAGLQMPAGTITSAFATSMTSSKSFGANSATITSLNAVIAGTTVAAADQNAGHQTYVVYMPSSGGVVTVSAVGGTGLAAAGRVAVSATATVVEPVNAQTAAATAAADAAADAAAEAIDAANAATDAANLAAEAADAATVAAEEARDAADAATAAVEALATEVATLMAALKAQITTLANTVAKIAKKVKA
jgi:hypothetical protein